MSRMALTIHLQYTKWQPAGAPCIRMGRIWKVDMQVCKLQSLQMLEEADAGLEMWVTKLARAPKNRLTSDASRNENAVLIYSSLAASCRSWRLAGRSPRILGAAEKARVYLRVPQSVVYLSGRAVSGISKTIS
ncbi:MAG: hypothetical protein M1830_002763 [Pleopsidium flavum]|nr:MAG: hypothetical protein M1830_002763 [Pleopsidium flavum]